MFKKININTIKSIVFLLSKRVAMIYVLLFVIMKLFTNDAQVELKTMHHLRPISFRPLIESSYGKTELNEKDFITYLEYFKKVARYTLFKSEAYAMMGYCYFNLDNVDRSIKFYKKALGLNSKYFWANYNLGVIYYKNGEYEKSVEYLKQAVAVTLQQNVMFMNKSRVYFTLVNNAHEYVSIIKKGFKEGYSDSFKLIILSYYNLNQFDKMRETAKYALSIGFEDKDTFNFYFGIASYNLGKYYEAITFFSRILKENKRHADAYYYVSLCFEKTGQETLAVQSLQMAKHLRLLNDYKPMLEVQMNPRVF